MQQLGAGRAAGGRLRSPGRPWQQTGGMPYEEAGRGRGAKGEGAGAGWVASGSVV